MTNTNVTEGQSLLDVAIGLLGSTARLFDLADANGLAVTDPLTPGQLLSIPDPNTANADLVAYFSKKSYRVNTQDAPVLVVDATAHDWDKGDFDFPDFDTQ